MTIFLLAMLACGDKDDGDVDETGITGTDDSATDDSATDDSGEDTDTSVEMVNATLSGNVSVGLYRDDADGDRESVEWADSTCGETYSLGMILVTAYYEDEDGKNQYVGEYVVSAPAVGDNPFELEIEVPENTEVYLYAAVDYYGDRVIGSSDPVGTYSQTIQVGEGDTIPDLDIAILAKECPTGGGGCTSTTISGDVNVAGWTSGDVAVMLVNSAGEGPYHVTWDVPTGEATAYQLGTCVGYGELRLVGAHDSNGNGLADPLDAWGAYSEEPDVDANPLNVGSEAMTGKDVQIPLGDALEITVVPFSRLQGEVTMTEGAFSDLSASGSLYIVASKYKVSGDLSVSELDSKAYADRAIPYADLAAETVVEFTLAVPANTVAYLYAFYDSDGDGVLNEPDEPIATEGKVDTETGTVGGFTLALNPVSE